jgi:hypothetical protein
MRNPHDEFADTLPKPDLESPYAGIITVPQTTFDTHPWKKYEPAPTEGKTPDLTRQFTDYVRGEYRKHMMKKCGDFEFEIILRRASAKWDGKESQGLRRFLDEELDNWRAWTCPGDSLRPINGWELALKNSEELAKRHIIGDGNAAIAKVDTARAEAVEALAKAESVEKEWNSDLAEFKRLKVAATKITGKIVDIENARAGLNVESLKADYKGLYARLFTDDFAGEHGAQASRSIGHTLSQVFMVIQERSLRMEVLADLEKGFNSELKTLKTKAQTLARKLGLESNL